MDGAYKHRYSYRKRLITGQKETRAAHLSLLIFANNIYHAGQLVQFNFVFFLRKIGHMGTVH